MLSDSDDLLGEDEYDDDRICSFPCKECGETEEDEEESEDDLE